MGDVDYGGFVGLKTDLQILNGLLVCRPTYNCWERFVGLKTDLQLLGEVCWSEGRFTNSEMDLSA